MLARLKITLERGPHLRSYVVRAEDGRAIHFEGSLDYEGLAMTFGWKRPDLGVPDQPGGGYRCGTPSLAMLSVAGAYLDKHIGAAVEDPGYFTPTR